jgi:hypothetical protein
MLLEPRMAIYHKVLTKGVMRFLRARWILLVIILLIGACVGTVLLNTFFLTLPRDGERALIAQVNADHCAGRGCREIQMNNLARMEGDAWCVNLTIYSPLRENDYFVDSYLMHRKENGAWEMARIPGSICDSDSLPGRKHILE